MAKVSAVTTEDGRVHMLDATGSPVTVDRSEVGQALEAGYQIEGAESVSQRQTAKQRGTIGELAKTAVEGAARGATLGLSDVAATELLGDEYRQAALERQQYNPTISTGSEIAGAIAPIALSGGTSAAARGVAALGAPVRGAAAVGRGLESATMAGARALGYTGASIPGRAAVRGIASGLGAAAEGTIYGAGKAMSDAALTGEELTAEKLVASMEDGLLLGGATGAGLGALGGTLSGAAKKFSGGKAGRSLQETAKEFRDESVLKAFGAKRRDFKDLTGRKVGEAAEKRWREVAEQAFDYRMQTGPKKGQKLFQAARSADDMADDVELAVAETGDQLRAMKQSLDEAGAAPDLGGFFARVQAEVLDPLRSSKIEAVRARAGKVTRQLRGLKKHYLNGGLPDAVADVQRLGVGNAKATAGGMIDERFASLRKAYKGASREEAEAIATGQMAAKDTGKMLKPVSVDVFDDGVIGLRDGRHRLAVAQEAGAENVLATVRRHNAAGEVVEEWTGPLSIGGADPPAGTMSFLEADQFRRELRSVFQPPKPKGGGLAAPPPAHAAELEKVERILADEIAESGASKLAELGQDPSAWKQANKRLSNFLDLQQIVQRNLNDVGNRFFSPTDHAMGMASFLGALATGNVGALTAMASGGAMAAANKLMREHGRSVVAELADRVSRMSSNVDTRARAIAGLLETPKRAPLAAVSIGDLRERYEAMSEQLREAQANPEVMQHILTQRTADIAAEYPELAQRVNMITMRQLEYLGSKLPPVMTRAGSSLTPLAEKAYTPVSEIKKFMRVEKGVNRPREVIEDISEGKIEREAIEALKFTHPELFSELQTKVATYVAERGESLPYRKRIYLSVVFDFTGDKSMRPENLRAIQDSLNAPAGEESKPGPAPRSLDPELAEGFATPSQAALM